MKNRLLPALLLLTVSTVHAQSWLPVGSPGFSAGLANYTSLAIDKSGTPYVVYEDYGNNYSANIDIENINYQAVFKYKNYVEKD